ncbi:MAG: phosphate ABC transporter substrate-binding protein [Magnetococcales bacterium]|nr:phosphate ABC transporter substrate-binding protein [Magnetococcales bacterium]
MERGGRALTKKGGGRGRGARGALGGALLLLALLLGWRGESAAGAHPQPGIRIKGSESLLRAMEALAEGFQRKVASRSGDSQVELLAIELTLVDVNGGGSNAGLSGLVNGHVDLAMASRPIREKERELAQRRVHRDVEERILAWDGVAVVVHPANPVNGLWVRQLAEIYGKESGLLNWSGLGVKVPGCDGGEIHRLSRKNYSGTYAFLRQALGLEERRMERELHYVETPREIPAKVINDPCAIGYAGMSTQSAAVKTLCLARAGEKCVLPSPESVKDGSYPLARPLYLYHLERPHPVLQEFLDYVFSPVGEAVVRQTTGYLPASEVKRRP